MPNWYPLQSSFAAGQLSERFINRQDTEVYQEGLLTMENMIPLPQGPAVRRPGTAAVVEMTNSLGGLIGAARIFPFTVSDDLTFLGVFGAGILRLFELDSNATPSAPVGGGGGATVTSQTLLNPEFLLNLDSWDWIQDPVTLTGNVQWLDLSNGVAEMTAGSKTSDIPNKPASTVELRQTVSVSNASNCVIDFGWVLKKFISTYSQTYPGTFTVNASLTGYGVSPVFSETLSNTVLVDANQRTIKSIPIGGSYTGDIYIWFSLTGETGAFDVASQRLVSFCNVYVDITAPSSIPFLATPYVGSEVDAIQYIQDPNEFRMIFTHPDYPPQELLYNLGTFTFGAAPLVNTPAWSGASGYPRACGAYQGRLILGGWETEPERVVGSYVGDWNDFAVTGSPTAVTGLDFILQDIGVIQWIRGQKDLIIGTINSEYLITGQSGILVSGDIDVRRQSAYGSKYLQAYDVGDQILYVTTDGRKVRAIEKDRLIDGWTSTDLTFASEDITKTGIVRTAYARDPTQILWAVLANGKAVGMSYERSQARIGWHQHTTDGAFKDVTTVRLAGQDYVLWVVERIVSNERRYFVEAMFGLDSQNEQVNLDGYVYKVYDTPVSEVTGLDEMEGREVVAINDGAVEPPQIVTGGTIPLQYPGQAVYVGANSHAILRTVPPAVPLNAGYGGIGAAKGFSRIGARLISSAKPLINGDRPPDRTVAAAMGSAEPLQSGSVYVADLGWTEGATIEVIQDVPVQLTVVGLYGKLTVDNV